MAAPVSSGRRGDAASAGHGTAGGSVGTCGSLLAEAPEEDVIGAPMLAACWDAEAGRRVVRRAVALGLRPEHFQRPSLGFLFSVLVDLAEAGEPVDPVAVAHEAERRALANVDAGVVDVDVRTLRARLEALAHGTVAVGVIEHRAGLVIDAARNRAKAAA